MESSIRFVLILAKRTFSITIYHWQKASSITIFSLFKQTSEHLEFRSFWKTVSYKWKIGAFHLLIFVFPRKGGAPSFLYPSGSRNRTG
jgi:hypothetical protein